MRSLFISVQSCRTHVTAGSLGIFDIDETSVENTVVEPGDIQAGSINLNATGDITISGDSQITASTVSRGQGGNLSISTPESVLIRNSAIEVSSTGLASSDNISIEVGTLTLKDEGLISAATASGEGGNIDINGDFVVAFPTGSEPNDGNDIDTTSELGPQFSGIVTINPPDINPLQGVNRLPTDPVSAETISSEVCSPEGGGSSLIFKGKGGLPPVPTKPFMADVLIPDGKPITIDKETDLNSLLVGEIETKQANPNYITADIKPIKTSIGDIYPARGIIKTEEGKIILTRYPTDNLNTRTPHKSANCTSS